MIVLAQRTPALRGVVLLAAAVLAACGGAPDTPALEPARPGLATLQVARESLPVERVWDGVVEAVNQATLSAQTGGRVLELPFDVNDHVEAGEVVVRFSDVEQVSARQRAASSVAAARAEFTEAEAAFRRTEELVGRQLLARAALDQARARRDAARAALQAAESGLGAAAEQVDYTVVRAPYTGILTERHVEIGESVQPGQPLVTGISLDRLRIRVELPQSDVAAIREYGEAVAILPDERRVPAERLVVFPYADPASHSFRVRAELPELATGLQPGMTVKLAFRIGESQQLWLPVSSLVVRSEVTAVYVVADSGRVALRQVRVGRRSGDRVEILAGLAEGEQVALEPLAALAYLTSRQAGAEQSGREQAGPEHE